MENEIIRWLIFAVVTVIAGGVGWRIGGDIVATLRASGVPITDIQHAAAQLALAAEERGRFGEMSGEEKHAYVLRRLTQLYPKVPPEVLSGMIDGAVWLMRGEKNSNGS